MKKPHPRLPGAASLWQKKPRTVRGPRLLFFVYPIPTVERRSPSLRRLLQLLRLRRPRNPFSWHRHSPPDPIPFGESLFHSGLQPAW